MVEAAGIAARVFESRAWALYMRSRAFPLSPRPVRMAGRPGPATECSSPRPSVTQDGTSLLMTSTEPAG